MIKFNWNPEEGLATCIITTGEGNTFIGEARCHPEDMDVASEYIGCDLASLRAEKKQLQYYKNNVIIPGYKALKQLYYSINTSKFYNDNSYEAYMIKRQMQIKLEELEAVKEEIKKINEAIKNFKINLDSRFTILRNAKSKREKAILD